MKFYFYICIGKKQAKDERKIILETILVRKIIETFKYFPSFPWTYMDLCYLYYYVSQPWQRYVLLYTEPLFFHQKVTRHVSYE